MPLTTSTPIFAVILAVVFAVWFAVERTLSIHSIVTTRREAFYWLAILFTFALGTAAGDLTAEKADLGYAVSIAIFGGMIAASPFAHYVLRLNPILSFWLAYILTRPLGASIGDGCPRTATSTVASASGRPGRATSSSASILALVAFLTITKRDQTPAEVVAQDLQAHPDHPGHPHHPHHQRPELAPQEG